MGFQAERELHQPGSILFGRKLTRSSVTTWANLSQLVTVDRKRLKSISAAEQKNENCARFETVHYPQARYHGLLVTPKPCIITASQPPRHLCLSTSPTKLCSVRNRIAVDGTIALLGKPGVPYSSARHDATRPVQPSRPAGR